MTGWVFPVRLFHSLLSAGFQRRTKRTVKPVATSRAAIGGPYAIPSRSLRILPVPPQMRSGGQATVRDHRQRVVLLQAGSPDLVRIEALLAQHSSIRPTAALA